MQASRIDIARRTRILQKARNEFFSHGFKSTDLAILAKELGISKKTLYLEFFNKKDLVQTVLEEKTQEIRAELSKLLIESKSSSADNIENFIECILRHLNEIKPPFMRDLAIVYPDLFEIVVKTRKELIPQYFGQVIAKGQKSGKIRSDVPKKIIVEILLSLAQTIMTPEKLTEHNLSPKNAYQFIISSIMDGVLIKDKRMKRHVKKN